MQQRGPENVDELKALAALLDITNSAWELATEIEKPERLKQLVLELRTKAREERARLKHFGRPATTRYELCLIGILEELNYLYRVPWEKGMILGLDMRLTRIRGEIERTIVEIKNKRRIM